MEWLQRRMVRLELNDCLARERANIKMLGQHSVSTSDDANDKFGVSVLNADDMDTIEGNTVMKEAETASVGKVNRTESNEVTLDLIDHGEDALHETVANTSKQSNKLNPPPNDQMPPLKVDATLGISDVTSVPSSSLPASVETESPGINSVTGSIPAGNQIQPLYSETLSTHETAASQNVAPRSDYPDSETYDPNNLLTQSVDNTAFALEALSSSTRETTASSDAFKVEPTSLVDETASSASGASDAEDVAMLRQRLQRKKTELRGLKRRVEQLERENAGLRSRWQPMYREDEMDQSIQPQDLVEDIKQAAAETAAQLQTQDMVYQPETGLYYDHGSGYYWDPNNQMYYDGNTGYYLSYDPATGVYNYVETTASEATPAGDDMLLGQPRDQADALGESNEARRRSASGEELEEGEIDSEEEERGEVHREQDRVQKRSQRNNRQRERPSRKPERQHYRPPKRQSLLPDAATSGEEQLLPLHYQLHKRQPPEAESVNTDPRPTVFESGPTSEVSVKEPPWLRMIVTQTEVKGLRLGSLYISTMDGITVGRDPSQQLHLEDANVSKYHAVIGYHGDRSDFYIRDLGSRNGTYVHGRRISAAKQESEDTSLPHGCELQLGSTALNCHVHPANDTCLTCEPGHMQPLLAPHVPVPAGVDSRQQRRQVADAIKQKYGLRPTDGGRAAATSVAPGYHDRAAERRVKKGSSHSSEKTETAHGNRSIPEKNKGFKLLQQMGWKEGQGLGRTEQGIVEPVRVEERGERRGLGCQEPIPPVVGEREKRKTEVWLKTQDRFKKLV